MSKQSGYIYLHLNKVNGHAYVGQSTQDPKRRFRHYDSSYPTYKNCQVFHKALTKYTWSVFDTKILAYADNQEELNRLEESYMKEYNSLQPNGYNIKPISEGRGKQAESSKQLMSEKRIEHFKKLKDQGIKIEAVNKKHHKFIDNIECKQCAKCKSWKKLNDYNKQSASWDNLYMYCRDCHLEYARIQKNKRSNKLTEEETKQSYIDRKEKMSEGVKLAYKNNPQLLKDISERSKKMILRIDITTGEEKIYESGLACKADGFDNTYVSQVCNGKRKTYKDYKWKFINKK